MPDLTYLTNTDPAGGTTPFYTLAKQYFVANGSTVVDAPSQGQTIEGILNDLKTREGVQTTVNIVSLPTGFGALGLPITLADQASGRSITVAEDVLGALTKKTLVPPGPAVIDDTTRVVVYGCDIGRSTNFLILLSCLFGNPGELLAPRRLSVFTLDGSTALYRQAQTWTLVKKAPLIPEDANAPVGGWPAYRTQFVNDATVKFGPAAILAEADGDTKLTATLTAAANGATTAMGPAFFLDAGIAISATATQTAKQVADSLKPMANGDPITAAAKSAAQIDDTTVVTTISGSDAYPTSDAQTEFSLGVVTLAQLIDQDVPIAEGPAYARVTSSKGLAPSLGPGVDRSGVSGSDDSPQSIIAALLAIGFPQEQIDQLLADVPQGYATDGLATESPDAELSPGDPDWSMRQANNV